MNEERIEQTEETEDIGFEGWDEPIDEAEAEETEEATAETESEADQPAQDEAETADTENEQAKSEEAQTKPIEETDTDGFELKHLGESKKYSRDEVKTLAQKGLDYDRIRADRDNLRANESKYREYEGFLKELAGENGNIEKLMEDVRTRRLRDSEIAAGRTISEQGAREQIQRERVARTQVANGVQAATDPSAKRHADFTAFAKAYPDVKGTDIPNTVWEAYKAGEADLTTLYARHENSTLRQQLATMKSELEAEKQNNKNRERAAGSRKGVGTSAVKDPIFEGWDD